VEKRAGLAACDFAGIHSIRGRKFDERRKRFLSTQFSETLLRYPAGDVAQRETAAR